MITPYYYILGGLEFERRTDSEDQTALEKPAMTTSKRESGKQIRISPDMVAEGVDRLLWWLLPLSVLALGALLVSDTVRAHGEWLAIAMLSVATIIAVAQLK